MNIQRLNRMKNTASHTGLFLTVLCEANRSGLCGSPSQGAEGYSQGNRILPRSEQTENSVSVCLSVSLPLTEPKELAGCAESSTCRPGLTQGVRRRQKHGAGHRSFSDLRQKHHQPLLSASSMDPTLLLKISADIYFVLTVPSPALQISLYQRWAPWPSGLGGPQWEWQGEDLLNLSMPGQL